MIPVVNFIKLSKNRTLTSVKADVNVLFLY